MRYFYSFLFYLALPIIFVRLWWKSRRLPDYRKRLAERLGHYPFRLEKCIWIHAVSVGETLAAIPLINMLKSQYPNLPILVTTMTPTGAARVKSIWGDKVCHAYIPYDVPHAVSHFLNNMHPVIGIIMEAELWPNMFAICQQRQIPVCVVNARLSEKSAQGYQRIASLTRAMLQTITVIAAHGQADAERFIALGARKENVIVTGSIKFDLALPPDLAEKSKLLRESLGKNRFVWIAASTHAGEEEIVLAAHKKLREQHPQALLILVPRHPDRFSAIAKLCEQSFVTCLRSQHETCATKTAVYLGDTMGELLLMYAASDVAFVGGSLIPQGGHNFVEPGALSLPILSGPHRFNFADISELFISAQALITVTDSESLSAQLILLMQNPDARVQMGRRAHQVVEANRGALAKQFQVVSRVINNKF